MIHKTVFTTYICNKNPLTFKELFCPKQGFPGILFEVERPERGLNPSQFGLAHGVVAEKMDPVFLVFLQEAGGSLNIPVPVIYGWDNRHPDFYIGKDRREFAEILQDQFIAASRIVPVFFGVQAL